jgi:hypothetical protein
VSAKRICQAKIPLAHGGSLQCYLFAKHRGLHEVSVDTTSGLLTMQWAPEYAALAKLANGVATDPIEVTIGVA